MKKFNPHTSAFFYILAILLSACNQTNLTPTTPTNSTTSPASIAPNTTNIIPIGIAVALTSNISLLGQDQADGAKIAEKYFNDQGGINGTPIKVIKNNRKAENSSALAMRCKRHGRF